MRLEQSGLCLVPRCPSPQSMPQPELHRGWKEEDAEGEELFGETSISFFSYLYPNLPAAWLVSA